MAERPCRGERASSGALLRRRCSCNDSRQSVGAGEAAGAESESEPRGRIGKARSPDGRGDVPAVVQEVLRSPGQPLDADVRRSMESRFGRDFSQVRVHADARAAASARAVDALAYTVDRTIVFGAGQYAPRSRPGQHLLAHELAHVAQQRIEPGLQARLTIGPPASAEEQQADAAADAVITGRSVGALPPVSSGLRRRAAPYVKKVTVHLSGTESADLEWEGSPPADASGSDHFTVSTGKGYSDPDDPAGTCKRDCCADAQTQCDSPWNRPEKVGACCTYVGTGFWTGTPLKEHNSWKWWTPVEPFYSTRGIALHQHPEVTGDPIGHGCIRMEEANAKRIFDFSNGRKTNVTIEGRASPVKCDADRKCKAAAGAGGGQKQGALEAGPEDGALADLGAAVVPGLEGRLS